MRDLAMYLDANRNGITGAIQQSDTINARAAVTTVETETVPAGANYVIMSATGDFYMILNGTAAIPADTTNGTAAELNPSIRTVTEGDTISVIAAVVTTAVSITFAYYK